MIQLRPSGIGAHPPIDLSTVTDRGPLDGQDEAYSGARLEWALLGDGRRVVLKHLPADGDWLTRATDGVGRARYLWASGLLRRAEAAVDTTVIDVVDDPDGHDVVVMRDASADLVPAGTPVDRAASRRLMGGLARLHAATAGVTPVPLCPLGARYRMFAAALAADSGPAPHPFRARYAQGWELFASLAPADLVSVVFGIHADAGPLERRLAAFPTVLLHGDAKPENLGYDERAGRAVAIDWGELTGFGPPEVDVAWFAMMSSRRLAEGGADPTAVFADYESASGRPLDREALDLACVGTLAQVGAFAAYFSVKGDTEESRLLANRLLGWWVRRAATALDRTAPP